MTTIPMHVIRVDDRYVTVESEEGHHCSFGDVTGWQPMVGDDVTVEIDSDEYPVAAWKLGRRVWPA